MANPRDAALTAWALPTDRHVLEYDGASKKRNVWVYNHAQRIMHKNHVALEIESRG